MRPGESPEAGLPPMPGVVARGSQASFSAAAHSKYTAPFIPSLFSPPSAT